MERFVLRSGKQMKLFGIALAAVLAAADGVAQTASAPSPTPSGEPAVAILASVHARELRFDDKPQVRVTVSGSVNGQEAALVSRTDRQNLPDEVQPYVTYRDIGIRLTITSTLPDIETILDEALAPAPQPAAPPRAASRKAPRRKSPK